MEEQLINEIQTIVESYNRVLEKTGENFNIFSIMRMESDEVRTHSRFLGELLNPNGSHNQGDVFLKIFVNLFTDDLDLDTKNTIVNIEHYIGPKTEDTGGIIDLIISDEVGRTIMIENKIYAGEQNNQLLRYHNFKPDGKLLYLTLYGHESSQSNNSVENIGISNSEIYQTVSYENDIISWLELCKKEVVDISIIRESINQYINLLKKLTNQNSNKIMNNNIANRILRDENSFESFKKIVRASNEVFRKVITEVVFPILDKVSDELELTLEIDRTVFLNSNNCQGFHFENPKNNQTLSFQFQARHHKNLIFGFINGKNKNDNTKKTLFLEKFKARFQDNFKSSNAWFCYNYYDFKEFRDWEDLDTLQKLQYGNFEDDLREKLQLIVD